MMWKSMMSWVAGVAMAACGDVEPRRAVAQMPAEGESPVCTIQSAGGALPEQVRESSGLARGRATGLYWTHNDAGNPAELFALDAAGRLVQHLSIPGTEAVDWEDIEAASCDGGSCLFIGDIGDNGGERGHVVIHVIREPSRDAASAQLIATLRARYADGPRDAEGLFVAPSGDIYIVTKGRSEAVELYRYPSPYRAGEVVVLERVRELFPQPGSEGRVSAATMSPDGNWVGVRSYHTLYLYRAARLLDAASEATPTTVDLRPLGHSQGESVAISDDGTVWLTSEAENRDSQPVWAALSCTFPK